jgi:hypothetical protein
LHLIASLIMDGGISYALYKMLHGLLGKKRDERQAAQLSPQYREAFKAFQQWNRERQTAAREAPVAEQQTDTEQEQYLSR